MGFASGLNAGVNAGNNWVKNYEDRKLKELEGTVFKAYEDLKVDEMQVTAEGEEIKRSAIGFATMNPDTLSTSLLNEMAMNGVKIDNNTYATVHGIANKLGAAQADYKLNQEKQANVELRGDRLNQTIFNASNNENRKAAVHEAKISGSWNPSGKPRTVTGSRKDKPDGYDVPTTEGGEVDYNKIKVGSKLFNKLSPDGKNEVRRSKNLPGGYTYPKKKVTDSKSKSKTEKKTASKFTDGKIYHKNGKQAMWDETSGKMIPLD